MEDPSKMAHAKSMSPYARFALMIGLSFLAMYVLMYAMVNTLPNAIPNYNQFYMAGLMTAPMVVLEMILMGAMYPEKKTEFYNRSHRSWVTHHILDADPLSSRHLGSSVS